MTGPPSKKGSKKGKKKKANENDVMHNVDKVFYEIQITDLNKKLARLRGRIEELEDTKIQLETKLGKMDEDRGDIICYLKRNLTERNTEVTDLQQHIANLTEMNAIQEQKHLEQMEKCRDEYENMREQLTSNLKMLMGQLNTLEDYRVHREELLKKFEDVQNKLDEQELKYRKQIYDMEKKAILDRANLKREMEDRMFNLATKFQEANEIRIAASSQRIVRENIAINNEINTLISSTNELDYENLLLKKELKKVIADYRLLDDGNKETIKTFSLQSGVIKELTNVNLKQKKFLEKYEVALQKSVEDKRKLDELLINEDIYKNNVKVLQNRLNAVRYSERDLQAQLAAEHNFRHHLEVIITDALLQIKSAIFEHPELERKTEIPNEGNLLNNVINTLTYTKSDVLPPSPFASISSVSLNPQLSQYPLPPISLVAEMKPPVRKLNVSTYLGPSFEDLRKQHDTRPDPVKLLPSQLTISKSYFVSSSEEIMLSSSEDEQSSSSNTDVESQVNENSVQVTEFVCDEMEEENEVEENIEEEKLVDESQERY